MLHISEKKFNDMREANPHWASIDYVLVTPNLGLLNPVGDVSRMELVGAPCGQHGQYTFYKALRLSGKRERIVAIGDFFFVRIWQDSELVSIGELQLLWTDRVSDQTLVSLRLYFLPENTPEGRCQHGEVYTMLATVPT
ncbi:AT-rich interactive domain-containing protein 5B [Papilio machaon]|uniref:AT-rich interactive domain-containing protein 5B n=1 Tax=Papilio machaon TaxID=76193 RepID=A0A0N1IPL5_PAPMA|nr:AT-rich interactive domain-containing protein 5B [Papilio machaon]